MDRQQTRPTHSHRHHTAPLPRGTETIVVAEGYAGVRRITVESLKALGYHVLQVDNGREALELARGGGPKIDALLTDMDIPLIDGFALSETLGAERPDLPIILSSTGGTQLYRKEVPELASHVRVLGKPYDLARLAWSLREALDGKKAVAAYRPRAFA